MRRLWLLTLLTALLLPTGCGYHFPDAAGELHGGIRRVRVELFHNSTLEPLVENLVSEAVVRELGRRRAVQVVAADAPADAVLTGVVAGYGNGGIGFGDSDRVAEYRVTIAIEATLRSLPDRVVLWKGQLSRYEDYLAHPDKILQEGQEAEAAAVASQRLAEDLYFRLVEGF